MLYTRDMKTEEVQQAPSDEYQASGGMPISKLLAKHALSSTKPAPLTAKGRKQASYGAFVSIIIMMAVVIVGAFYAWNKRIAERSNTPKIEQPQQTY
jgi:hypothetical protein